MSNLFKDEPTQTQDPAQGNDALTTKLASIVNEQGEPKYATLEVALDALKTSQEFIPTLKTQVSEKDAEIATLREQVARTEGVKEALERFAATPKAQHEEQEETPTATLGEEDIKSLVQNLYQEQTQQTQAEKNFDMVQNSLKSQYGDKASEHIANKAKELNTTREYLEDMAKTNPTMALQLLDTKKASAPTPSYGGTNTASFSTVKDEPIAPPKSSLLVGAKKDDVSSYINLLKNDIYKTHGIDV